MIKNSCRRTGIWKVFPPFSILHAALHAATEHAYYMPAYLESKYLSDCCFFTQTKLFIVLKRQNKKEGMTENRLNARRPLIPNGELPSAVTFSQDSLFF